MNNNKNSCKGFLNILNEFIVKNYKKFYITMGNGKKKKKIEKRLYSIFTKAFFIILSIFIIEALFVLSFLIFSKEHDPKYILELLGPFGDFFGGMLNPILTFCTFMALLMTIILQQRELKLSREQISISAEELGHTRIATENSAEALKEQSNSIKIQNFETTFFNMLNLHNEIVKNISIQNNSKFTYEIIDSRQNIENYNKVNFSSTSKDNSNQLYGREAINMLVSKLDSFIISKKARIFNRLYDLCQDATQKYLGHYFGNIYQILKFISSNNKLIETRKYSDLFRAQFSSSELKLLFYHCIGEIGSKKFKNYIEEFEFFEHLFLEEKNINFKFILCSRIYKQCAFGDNNDIESFISKYNEESNTIIDDINNIENPIAKLRSQRLDLLHYYRTQKYKIALEIMSSKEIIIENQNELKIIIEDIKNEISKANTTSQEPQ
ncbi:putative phage abortive infection protein [Aliarcobacter butzleri]